MELTASDAGRVQLSLAARQPRGRPRQRQARRDGTADYRLKLPKGPKAGSLHAEGDLQDGHRVAAELTLTGKASARRASSALPGVTLGRGPRALPDGRFHGDPPARTFKVR